MAATLIQYNAGNKAHSVLVQGCKESDSVAAAKKIIIEEGGRITRIVEK